MSQPVSRKRIRTEAQLQRKRTRDRESQRISREKNKERMATIETELSELYSRYDALLAFTNQLKENPNFVNNSIDADTTSQLDPPSTELIPLQTQPTLATSSLFTQTQTLTDGAVHSGPVSGHSQLASSPTSSTPQSILVEDEHSSLSNPSGDFSSNSPFSTAISEACDRSIWDNLVYELPIGAGLYQSSSQRDISTQAMTSFQTNIENKDSPSTQPSIIEPSASTACLCGYIHANRLESERDCLEITVFKLLFDAHTAIASNPEATKRYPRSPSISNLLLIEIDSNPVVKAIGKMMQKSPLTQLADSMAVIFVIYRLLRWRVFPVAETYYDIPEWYRPSALQRQRPHPLYIDLIAWPELRDFLISSVDHVDNMVLGQDIGESLTVEWPNDQQLFVKDLRTNEAVLNPKFEEHIWNYSNWKMRRRWSWRQPRLVDLVNLSKND